MPKSLPPFAWETERLLFQRLAVEEHLEGCHEIISDERAMSWSTRPVSTSLEMSRRYMLGDLRTPETPWIEYFVFFLKPPGPLAASEKQKLVGMIGVVRLDPRQEMHGLGDGFDNAIGYRVHPDYWAKGIGTEALKGFLELYWALDERKDVLGLVAQIDINNLGSLRMMEKIGAKPRKELGKAFYGVNGREWAEFKVWDMERPRLEVEKE